jgi:hypothetical protein
VTAPPEVRHALSVDRGVALLDAKLGQDVWLPRVNLATLDVASSDSCVACQATGHRWYSDAVEALGLDLDEVRDEEGVKPSWTERHGFGISLATLERDGDRDFTGLQEAWVQRIRQLRGEGTPA